MYQLLINGLVVMTDTAENIAETLSVMSNIEGCEKLDEISQQIMNGNDGGKNWNIIEVEN